MAELLTQYSCDDLRQGLSDRASVVYRHNGNRTMQPEAFLERLLQVTPRAGIHRLSELSRLSPLGFPVFQSARPGTLHHGSLGLNTGAQGKGRTPVQAKISCLMESLEAYCAEPRAANLIRGTYRDLRRQQLIISPTRLFRRMGAEPATVGEPLMWTPALHLASMRQVLVPAESVYFYFTAQTYETRSVFPLSTCGLGGGATYLEAVTHGLYELIERMYFGFFEQRQARARCLLDDPQLDPLHEVVSDTLGSEYQLQLHTLHLPDVRNLPMVTAVLAGDHDSYLGQGCAADIETAIDRAVSEALQAYATHISGSREDVGRAADTGADGGPGHTEAEFPDFADLPLDEYRSLVESVEFDSLQAELQAQLAWLRMLGFHNVFVANLTRHGIDIPIVRVFVAGLPFERKAQCRVHKRSPTEDRVAALRYSFHPGQAVSA